MDIPLGNPKESIPQPLHREPLVRLLPHFMYPDGIRKRRVPLLPEGVICYIEGVRLDRLWGGVVEGEGEELDTLRAERIEEAAVFNFFFSRFWGTIEIGKANER